MQRPAQGCCVGKTRHVSECRCTARNQQTANSSLVPPTPPPRGRSSSQTRLMAPPRACSTLNQCSSYRQSQSTDRQRTSSLTKKPVSSVQQSNKSSFIAGSTSSIQQSNKSSLIADSTASLQQQTVIENVKANSQPVKEPTWDNMLSFKNDSNSQEISSFFTNFNPANKLKFLTEELAVKPELSGNEKIIDIINSMQEAINRLSAICFNKPISVFLKTPKPPVVTPISKNVVNNAFLENEKERYSLQLLQNARELEESCQRMESLCVMVYNEKTHFELMFYEEQKRVKRLEQEMESMRKDKDEADAKIKTLEMAREKLQYMLDKEKNQQQKNNVSYEKVKSQLKKIKQANVLLEQECGTLRGNLQKQTQEVMKKRAIDAVRETYIKDLHNFLGELHVSNADFDDENAEYLSDDRGQPPQRENVNVNLALSPINANETTLSPPRNKSSNSLFRELISQDDLSNFADDNQIPTKDMPIQAEQGRVNNFHQQTTLGI